MTTREDVYCPACPNPATAFRQEDVGIKFEAGGDYLRDDEVTFTVSRPAWEPVMIEHCRQVGDAEHQRLYDLCVTELMAAEQTAEEAARSSVQATVDGLRRSMSDTARRLR